MARPFVGDLDDRGDWKWQMEALDEHFSHTHKNYLSSNRRASPLSFNMKGGPTHDVKGKSRGYEPRPEHGWQPDHNAAKGKGKGTGNGKGDQAAKGQAAKWTQTDSLAAKVLEAMSHITE